MAVGPLLLPPGFRKPAGVFRFQPAVLTPNGDLILPGHRITPDLRVLEEPEATAGLQGLWPDDGMYLPVSGFHVRRNGRPALAIYPGAGKRSPDDPTHGGILMWADPVVVHPPEPPKD